MGKIALIVKIPDQKITMKGINFKQRSLVSLVQHVQGAMRSPAVGFCSGNIYASVCIDPLHLTSSTGNNLVVPFWDISKALSKLAATQLSPFLLRMPDTLTHHDTEI